MPSQRSKVIPAVHLILERNTKTLLLRRFNTGFEDGNYSLIAGHVDEKENAKKSMIREAREEAGIDIKIDDLELVHVMHRNGDHERIDLFFKAKKWQGTPKIMEEDKCDEITWFNQSRLPSNTIPYIKSALDYIKKKQVYSELGWSSN